MNCELWRPSDKCGMTDTWFCVSFVIHNFSHSKMLVSMWSQYLCMRCLLYLHPYKELVFSTVFTLHICYCTMTLDSESCKKISHSSFVCSLLRVLIFQRLLLKWFMHCPSVVYLVSFPRRILPEWVSILPSYFPVWTSSNASFYEIWWDLILWVKCQVSLYD